MSPKAGSARRLKTPKGGALRASVSFSRETYRVLEGIAKEKKVSVAWVVRDATEKYIADLYPLFGGNKAS